MLIGRINSGNNMSSPTTEPHHGQSCCKWVRHVLLVFSAANVVWAAFGVFLLLLDP